MHELRQVLNTVNIGLVILDRDLNVREWNRWMAIQSGFSDQEMIGGSIFVHFPALDNPKFHRNCKSVLTFGNFTFFSQKLHGHLFPFRAPNSFQSSFDLMQQSCTMGPIRDDSGAIVSLFLIVQDVTELAAYEKKLVEMNMRDGLTGVFNRRFLDRRLDEEFYRSRRYDRPFSIILIDIDHFKKVNDTYGHSCGDQVLKSVAHTVSHALRMSDGLARYGGEEFCCILPETGLDIAALVAEKLRHAVEDLDNLFDGQRVKVTISLGVAQQREDMERGVDMMQVADTALYHAKRTGRNRVVTMNDVIVPD